MPPQNPIVSSNAPDSRTAGIVIAVCAGLAIVAIAHHPTVAEAPSADLLKAIARLAASDRVVHSILIVLIVALTYGFSVFSQRQGMNRSSVLAGLIAYVLGSAALVCAAVVDGYLTPDIAILYGKASADAVGFAIQILNVCALMIQVLTKLGLIAYSAAILMWCVGLVRSSGGTRAAGACGIVISILVTAVLLDGNLHLTPESLLLVFGAQAVWYLAVAVLMIRNVL